MNLQLSITYEFDKLRSLFISSCAVRISNRSSDRRGRENVIDFPGNPRDVLYELYELSRLGGSGISTDYDLMEGSLSDDYFGNRNKERYMLFSEEEFGWRGLTDVHARLLPVYREFVSRYGFEDSRENRLENC